MNFYQAVGELLKGNCITRSNLNAEYIQFHKPDENNNVAHFMIHYKNNNQDIWFPNKEDSDATDWEIYNISQ